MNHQIALVGGQLLPVYLGIKEYEPAHIHFIVSEESQNRVAALKSIVGENKTSEYFCDPYSFSSVFKTIEKIIADIDDESNVQINLTGGTKIMFLAAQSFIQEKRIKGFYINQNETVLLVPEFIQNILTCNLTVQEFLQLSGHTMIRSKSFESISDDEVKEAFAIRDFVKDHEPIYAKLNGELRKVMNSSGGSLPKNGNISISGPIELTWNFDHIHLQIKGITLLELHSKSARPFFFYAGWWEFIVADAIRKWDKTKEICMQCEIPFKVTSDTSKNEIDILLNLGKKLIFIECKSGKVTANDIHKMKAVKDTYGGLISKSILVSRFKPSSEIVERCFEQEIEIFFIYDNRIQVNRLEDLMNSLDKLDKKFSIL